MNKFVIDYEYGIADFYTDASDDKEVLRQFWECASVCFGIRKSLGETKIDTRYLGTDLPIPYRDKGGTQFLAHHGDEILFNDKYKTHDGKPWKLYNEHGEWCTCRKLGREELSCEVHHFWVKNHNKKCKCMDKE